MFGSVKQWLSRWVQKGATEANHKQLSQALHADPVLHEFYRAHYLKRDKDPAGALAAIEQCLKRRDDQATLHHLRGRLLGILGNTTEAAESYRRCLALEPRHEVAAGYLALLLVQTDDREEGEALARFTLAYDPHNVISAMAILSNLHNLTPGKAQQLLKFSEDWIHPNGTPRFDGSRRRRRRFVEHAPLLRIPRGALRTCTPQWRTAREDLEFALQFNEPTLRRGTLETLIRYWMGCRDYAAAEKYLNDLAALPDAQWSAAIWSGIWNECQRRREQARQAYESSLRLASSEEERGDSVAALAWFAIDDNKRHEAEQILAQAPDSSAGSIAVARARVRLEDRDFAAAEAALEPSLGEWTQHVCVHYIQGLVKAGLGEVQASQAAFRAVVSHADHGYLLLDSEAQIVERCRSLMR
jgi:Flp pilus assembly protein TadD